MHGWVSPHRTIITFGVAQVTGELSQEGGVKSLPGLKVHQWECHTTIPDVWWISNLYDAEAKDINFQGRGDRETTGS